MPVADVVAIAGFCVFSGVALHTNSPLALLPAFLALLFPGYMVPAAFTGMVVIVLLSGVIHIVRPV